MNDLETWRDNYKLTIKVALMCVLLGLGCVYFYESLWIRFWGTLFVILGLGFFFMAYKLKKKYLQLTIPQTNLKGE